MGLAHFLKKTLKIIWVIELYNYVDVHIMTCTSKLGLV